jgi:ABC-type bacteriocin/lantibiotic exporter with double-glycine peptidase domain
LQEGNLLSDSMGIDVKLCFVIVYLGTSLAEEDIADACNTTEAGTTLIDAVHAVHSLGFNATRIQNATLEDLMHYLNHNEPVRFAQ